MDFANQAMLFGAGLLVSLLPFVILLSAFGSQRVRGHPASSKFLSALEATGN